MKRSTRQLVGATVLFLLVAVLARADDRVEYRKGDKTVSVTGQVTQENVGGLKVKPATGKEVAVPSEDVVKVSYEMPGAVRLDYGKILAAEEKGELARALEDYKTLPPRMGSGTDQAKRHVQYRIAMLKAALGEPDAAEALGAFLKANPNAWQYASAARQLAYLQLNKGSFDDAARTVETLARNEGLSKAVRQSAELMLIDIQFQAGKFADVQAKIKGALASLPPSDPQRPKLEVYQIGCEGRDAPVEATAKKLETIIEKTDDRSLKALAYNTLGDCYSAKGKKEDAKFAYLWVDAVYNQDRQEHVKALERLAKLFEEDPLKDEARAQLFRDKAVRSR